MFSWHCEEEDGDEEESETGSDTDTDNEEEDDVLDGECAMDDEDEEEDEEEDEDDDNASDTEGMLRRWLGDQTKYRTTEDGEREKGLVKEFGAVRVSKPWSI